MKYLYILLTILMLTLVKISGNASVGAWEYVEKIPTKTIYVADYSQQQEQFIEKPVEPKQPSVEEVEIVNHNGMKTWMPHNLFGENTLQYAVQQLAETDEYGLKGVAGRYCVAVGSRITTTIGELIDVVLENGEVIPCVVADAKADCDTESTNTFTVGSGCCCEFIVDKEHLADKIRQSGDISTYLPEWDSPIVEFRIYEGVNVLEN